MNLTFEDSVFPDVVELEFTRHVYADPEIEGCLRRIATKFPNLKKFKFGMYGIDLDDLPILFSSWRDIEEMELLITHPGTSDINLVLSGYHFECEWLVKELMASKYKDLMSIAPPHPSLPKMSKLTKVIMEFGIDGYCPEINDIGIQLAFLRMQPLLSLTFSGTFFISESNVQKLTEHHKNVFILPKTDK